MRLWRRASDRVNFDWSNPDYTAVFRHRIKMLEKLRADPDLMASVKAHYKWNPADFINDFGMTHDPRQVEIGRPAYIPFMLFGRQREWIEWVMWCWRNRELGASPKSRESGVSWLSVSLACTLCLFHDGVNIGFGSRKQEYVDLLGSPKSLFWKAREFMRSLPVEFRNGFNVATDAPHMRLMFRETGSSISGESGDSIGRGDRASIYFVDEAAFLERPQIAESALSATTNCRIDISTANGIGNPFYQKVTTWKADNGPDDRGNVFFFSWRQDPRKDEAWYAKQVAQLDPVTVAQEIDIDFAASVEGVLIPSAWVQAAVGAHLKRGIEVSGERVGALDVADEGADKNAFCVKHGQLIEHIEEWSGKGDDIFGTVVRAFGLADEHKLDGFRYDADGLGAGVRGDARVVNEDREATRQRVIDVDPFRGSGEILDPEGEDTPGRKNKDFFQNRKAQEWWRLRKLFQTTYRAVTGPSVAAAQDYDPDEIISISPAIPPQTLSKLIAELSQPTFSLNNTGKIVIDKAPEGTRSPNLADACMIAASRSTSLPMRIHSDVMEEIRSLSRRRRA